MTPVPSSPVALLDQLDAEGDEQISVLDRAAAVPRLTAAVRAVLKLADSWAALEHWDYKGPEKLARARADSANDAARILREHLTTALSVTP